MSVMQKMIGLFLRPYTRRRTTEYISASSNRMMRRSDLSARLRNGMSNPLALTYSRGECGSSAW